MLSNHSRNTLTRHGAPSDSLPHIEGPLELMVVIQQQTHCGVNTPRNESAILIVINIEAAIHFEGNSELPPKWNPVAAKPHEITL